MNRSAVNLIVATAALAAGCLAQNQPAQPSTPYKALRLADGKPDLQGIWMARNGASFDVAEVAEGGQIPYLPESLEREQKGPACRSYAHCAMPGVPRITYLPFPFEIIAAARIRVLPVRISA